MRTITTVDDVRRFMSAQFSAVVPDEAIAEHLAAFPYDFPGEVVLALEMKYAAAPASTSTREP